MRVVITGASGNVGTSLLHSLSSDPGVETIVGLARRRPGAMFAKTEWAVADVASSDLVPQFRGADAVVHLAWLIQPSRNEHVLARTNVTGSERVFDAVAKADVPALVYASSVGAYSPGPKHDRVDESWPTEGVSTSFYSRHKARVERMVDRFEADHPSIRVVRLRPGLIFKREAGSEVRRLFAGPLLPAWLLRPRLIPAVPDLEHLRFQAVHSLDVGDAYRLAVTKNVSGPFNIAAEPVLDPRRLAELFDARPVRVPAGLVRGVATATWKLHLQPTPPGWVDLALEAPLLDTRRARDELGWVPRYSSEEALLDLLDGMRTSAGIDTPPLAARTSGRLRMRELVTGVGRR